MTNGREEKLEKLDRSSDAASGPIFKISKFFHKSKQKLYIIFYMIYELGKDDVFEQSVEFGTGALQFLFWEYVNGIFIAVYL